MGKEIKVVLIGVSNYYIEGANDLPFCKNDVLEMESSLINGLKVDKSNILKIGLTGDVYISDFIKSLKSFAETLNDSDTVIFYFSGHGTNIQGEHYLVFSDEIMKTNEIIKYFEVNRSKSKIIFLDCCMSGNYDVDKSAKFDSNMTIDEFYGSGYAVFSSSSATQVSFGHPKKPISVFTSFLSNAIQDKFMIREGKKSLFDIKKLVYLYLEIWNRNNPDRIQHPVFRANMGGTIYFAVEEYEAYPIVDSYVERDKYIIYEIEPSHHISAKRYAAKVILKAPMELHEIAELSKKIKMEIISAEVYSNAISENRFSGMLANIIWIYFCRSHIDIRHGNYICHTTWVDDSQDKAWWYKVNSSNKLFIENVHFDIHTSYDYLHGFIEDNTGDNVDIIRSVKEISSKLISLAEEVILHYNEFKNGVYDEGQLIQSLKPILTEIDNVYFESTELNIADDSIHEWDKACTSLFTQIHNFIFYFNDKYFESRTPENRIQCMDMTIKEYYKSLRKVIEFEEQIIND